MRGSRFWCTVAAAVAVLDTAGSARQSRVVPQARDPIGIAWLIFVDDLHIDFRNTGYLRNLLKSIASDLIRDRDVFAVRSTGPSSLSIDLTADKSRFEDAIPKTSGSGMKEAEIQAAIARGQATAARGHGELEYRVKVAVGAASEMMETVKARNRRRALVYVSNGYATDVSTPLSSLSGLAWRSNITIFAMNPRGLPGSPFASERSPASQNSLRALVEPTRGFALLDDKDYADGMIRIRRAMLASRR